MGSSSRSTVVAIGSARSFVICCDSCVARDSAACADCVVTHLLADSPRCSASAEAEQHFDFDDDEWAAVDLLVHAGLVPTLRHREAAASTDEHR
jgi:hypothetical protein